MVQEEALCSQFYYMSTWGILFKLRQFIRVTNKDLESKPGWLKKRYNGIKMKSAYKTACHTSPDHKW
jgi:hypothetical protein